MSISSASGVLITVNGYNLRFHPEKFRDLAAKKLKDANFAQIQGNDNSALQAGLEAAFAGVEFTNEEVRQFAFNDDGGDIPADASLDHNGIAGVVIEKVKAEDGAIQSTVANLDYAVSMGLVKIVEPKGDDVPPPSPGDSEAAARLEAERLKEAARLEAERLKEAARLEAERLEAEQLEAEQLEAEQQVDPNAPKGPGFWAKFGSWILGGLGILSAIGAFFAHAEGKARAFFAILGGLLLGGAIVNKWRGFGKAIFGGTNGTKQQPDAANPALEPGAEPQTT